MQFKFTNPSKDELEFRNLQFLSYVLFFLYFIVVGAIIWFLNSVNDQELWTNALYYPIVIFVNLVIMFPLGVLIIRAIVLPYSFWGSRNAIIGSNCIRYGEEFATLVEKSYVLMRIHMMKLIEEELQKSDPKKSIETEYLNAKLLKFK